MDLGNWCFAAGKDNSLLILLVWSVVVVGDSRGGLLVSFETIVYNSGTESG